MASDWMRRSLVASYLVLCGAALVAGCASNSAPSAEGLRSGSSTSITSPSSTGNSFRYVGAITAAARLDGGDIRLDVPPSNAVAAVSPQTAFAVCGKGRSGVCTTSSVATMKLALVTATAAGTAGPDGSIIPLIDDALTYVIEWTGLQCPAPAGPMPATTLTARRCHLVDFVSAKTGKYLYAFEGSD